MREATEAEVTEANAILAAVTYVHTEHGKSIDWKGHKHQAFRLAKDLFGYTSSNKGCITCNFQALNYVREIVGQPPIGGEASHSLRQRRIEVCRGVAGDGSDACEHLAWPGLNCGKCGCFIDIKATFKRFRCPVNKWPIA